jgi:hypothetical protein
MQISDILVNDDWLIAVRHKKGIEIIERHSGTTRPLVKALGFDKAPNLIRMYREQVIYIEVTQHYLEVKVVSFD